MATIRELIRSATKVVVRVEKESTGNNLPCQIHLNAHFDYGGGETADAKITVNPGLLRDLGADEVECDQCGGTGLIDGSACSGCQGAGQIHDASRRFQEMWDQTPDRNDAVNIAWKNHIPDKLWNRLAMAAYKVKEQEEE